MPEPLKIGLIVGAEAAFPDAVIREISDRNERVVAELVRIGSPRMVDPVPYAVIIDRMSHQVPFYRTYLKHAALQGCRVINDPFLWSADDKFFGASLAGRLGIRHPRTRLLPHKEYVTGLQHDRSLRNLEYPLDWQGVVADVGLPCVLKDAHGGGGADVHVCRSLDELLLHYNESGQLLMIAEEYVEWDRFVRCLCIGREQVLPMEYHPGERPYAPYDTPLPPALVARITEDSRRLVTALGYDMNCVEWAVRDGSAYVVDLANPVPELEPDLLGEANFRWAVDRVSDLAIRLAKEGSLARSPRTVGGTAERLTGASDLDGAGDLAEEFPSLARDLPRRTD